LVDRGYPLELAAQTVHEGVERLQSMLNREIDEAEALQAAGECTFVFEPGCVSTGASCVERHVAQGKASPADTRPLSVDNESEGDNVN